LIRFIFFLRVSVVCLTPSLYHIGFCRQAL